MRRNIETISELFEKHGFFEQAKFLREQGKKRDEETRSFEELNRIYIHEAFTYNNDKHTLTVKGKECDLTVKESEVLRMLTRYANRIIPVAAFKEKLWPEEDRDITNVLRAYIYTLRRKIEPDKSAGRYIYIQSKYKRGYILHDPNRIKKST